MARRAHLLLIALAALALAAVPADARIYWANRAGNTIGSAYLDGSSDLRQDFITGTNGAQGVAADEAHVFWSEPPSSRAGWANADGTQVDHAIIHPDSVYGIAVRGTKIFWSRGSDIARATLTAPVADNETSFITGTGLAYQVATDSGHVYWADYFNHRIGRAHLDGTNVARSFIAPGDAGIIWFPLGLAVNGQHIYWTNPTGIARSDLEGGNIQANFITGLTNLTGLAVDRKHLYWSTFTATIGRANLDGTNVEPAFITGGSETFGIAVNGAPRDGGGAPTLSGGPMVGQQLTCSRDNWFPQGDPMTYGYAWLDNGAAIPGETGTTFTPQAGNAGHNFACRVTASNDGGDLSATTGSIYVPIPPSSAGPPSISGTVEIGQQLTCSPGAWYGDGPLTYTYEWLRNGFTIEGAFAATYVITGPDQNQTLSCLVRATGPGGQASATSAGVVVPEPAAQPTPPRNVQLPAVSGVAMAGNVLTCAPGAWTDAGGFAYAWLRDGSPIAGAGITTYTTGAQDVGRRIACRVTAANAAGQASADSLGVLIVAAPQNLTPSLTRLSLTPTVFRAARRGASISTHTVTGTRVRFTLSKSAAVTFTVARRNANGRFVKQRGSFRHRGTAGGNRIHFTGRLAGRRLAAGRYRLTARPRDGAGRTGASRRAAFRIVR